MSFSFALSSKKVVQGCVWVICIASPVMWLLQMCNFWCWCWHNILYSSICIYTHEHSRNKLQYLFTMFEIVVYTSCASTCSCSDPGPVVITTLLHEYSVLVCWTANHLRTQPSIWSKLHTCEVSLLHIYTVLTWL